MLDACLSSVHPQPGVERLKHKKKKKKETVVFCANMPPNIPEDGARPREESEGLKARRTEASVLVRGANETLGRSAVGIEPFQLRLPRSERVRAF